MREWGRIGMAGKVRIDPYVDEGRAVNALSDLMLAKRKRGYQYLGSSMVTQTALQCQIDVQKSGNSAVYWNHFPVKKYG